MYAASSLLHQKVQAQTQFTRSRSPRNAARLLTVARSNAKFFIGGCARGTPAAERWANPRARRLHAPRGC